MKEKETEQKEFKFKIGEHGNACHVFVENVEKPVDSIFLVERGSEWRWEPASAIANYFVSTGTHLDEVKERYNRCYDELCFSYFPEKLLELPESVDGYIAATHGVNKVEGVDSTEVSDVTCTKVQAEALKATSRLSHMVARLNEGWTPDWSSSEAKWCICRANNKDTLIVVRNSPHPHFLAFRTQEKAAFFASRKLTLIQSLLKAKFL